MLYIGLFKKITDSWIFENPVTLKVWIFMLCEAAENECDVAVGSKTVHLQEGQLASGRGYLMKRLALTERQARSAVEQLVNNKVITLDVSSTYSVVTLLKYQHYQGLINKTKAKSVQQDEPIEKPERTADFDKWWGLYPKKQAKFMATKSWAKINPSKELAGVMIRQLKLFKASKEWMETGGKYIPMPSTWLNQRRWEDELESKAIEERPTLEESL